MGYTEVTAIIPPGRWRSPRALPPVPPPTLPLGRPPLSKGQDGLLGLLGHFQFYIHEFEWNLDRCIFYHHESVWYAA